MCQWHESPIVDDQQVGLLVAAFQGIHELGKPQGPEQGFNLMALVPSCGIDSWFFQVWGSFSKGSGPDRSSSPQETPRPGEECELPAAGMLPAEKQCDARWKLVPRACPLGSIVGPTGRWIINGRLHNGCLNEVSTRDIFFQNTTFDNISILSHTLVISFVYRVNRKKKFPIPHF